MVSDEKTNDFGIKYESHPQDQGVIVLSRHPNKHVIPTNIASGSLSKADRIRGVTRSLVVDALAVLDKMQVDCQSTPALKENYYQLYHCLDYLKRFCDGKV